MRGQRILASLILLAWAAAPVRSSGSGKDDPMPPWAESAVKTPTPAYAGDAARVILYQELVDTVDARGRATERQRWATRILKAQARDTVCTETYDVDRKINYFHEWTLTADGKVFEAKDTDFLDVGDTSGVPVELSTEKTRVVHAPAADVGATLICESEELMPSYVQERDWQVRYDLPVVYEAWELDLPEGTAHAEAWHRHDAVKPAEVGPNHWRWEIRDQHALDVRDIPSRPASAALYGRMTVQWGEIAVPDLSRRWQAMGAWFARLEAGRPDPSAEITTKTQQLIAGAPDFYSKLAAITAYIQRNMRYFVVERGIGGQQAHPAADIFSKGYGDCKDKTTLLISMLQVAGIKAYYVPVDNRRGVVDPSDPSLGFNHMITAIELPPDVKDPRLQAVVTTPGGAHYLIFDPTDERTPVGNLPSDEQGSYALLAAGSGSQIMHLPVLPPEANGTTQTGKFTLAADGTLSGTVDSAHIGPEGADLREFLKYTDETERRGRWEKRVAHDLPGVVLDSFQFTQPEALAKPVEFHYKVTEQDYAHNASTLLLVRPRVVGSMAQQFNDKPRQFPIELDATGRWHDSFDIALPAGYGIDELPDPVDLDLDFASYHSKTTATGNVLHYEREYIVRQVEIPATRAADFRKLQGTILQDEQSAAVLKKQ